MQTTANTNKTYARESRHHYEHTALRGSSRSASLWSPILNHLFQQSHKSTAVRLSPVCTFTDLAPEQFSDIHDLTVCQRLSTFALASVWTNSVTVDFADGNCYSYSAIQHVLETLDLTVSSW